MLVGLSFVYSKFMPLFQSVAVRGRSEGSTDQEETAVSVAVFSSMPIGCQYFVYKQFGGSAGEQHFIKDHGRNLHPSALRLVLSLDYNSLPLFPLFLLPSQCPLLPSSSSCLGHILHILRRYCRFVSSNSGAETKQQCHLSPRKYTTRTCWTNNPWPKNFAHHLYLECFAV